jgi:hypothetical protein
MKSPELISIYQSSYKSEFDSIFIPFEEMYQSAIDKKYAIEFTLGTVGFVYLFRLSSSLEQQIIDMYDHSFKLGGTIEDVIKAIPEIIETHKTSEEHRKQFEPKKKSTIIYKRFLGIPYGIEKVVFDGEMKIGSMFESLITIAEIAAELGRQRAIIDLTMLLKRKYVEHGGVIDSESVLAESDLMKMAALKSSFAKNELNNFFKILQELFASLSYNIKITEGYFHSHIHLLLRLLDFKVLSEQETNIGRIDCVVETEKYIYIMEFKKDDATEALNQILGKKYYQSYLASGKDIILVGVAFDNIEKNIIDWKSQALKHRT